MLIIEGENTREWQSGDCYHLLNILRASGILSSTTGKVWESEMGFEEDGATTFWEGKIVCLDIEIVKFENLL